MKKELFKRILSLSVVMIMLAGMLLLPVIADETSPSESVGEAVAEATEPYVIFTAEQMEGNVSGPSKHTEISFVDEGDDRFLRLAFNKEGNDLYAAFTPGEYSADEYKYVTVLARAEVKNGVEFSIYYATEGNGGKFKGGCEKGARFVVSPYWQFITLDFSEVEGWSGNINQIRLDAIEGGTFPAGVYCDVAAVVFSKTSDALYDAAYDVVMKLFTPTQMFTDFTESDLPHIGASPVKTEVKLENGNLLFSTTGDMKDPSTTFRYADLANSRGVQELTTEDFRYVVIRYRTSMNFINDHMELFIITGAAKSLMDMIRIKDTYSCHSGETHYAITRTWSGMVIDLAEDDGRPQNTQLMNGWQGRGKVTGFRFDWVNTGFEGAYMEISDFMFYKSESDARNAANALKTLNVMVPLLDEDDRETEKVIMPWETETEVDTETEETVPVFSEETLPVFTEETTEVVTETVVEIETEQVTEEITETEEETETEVETQTGGQSGGDISGGIDIGDNIVDTPVDVGSQTPFYIACGAMACLCVASVVTVLVIRSKNYGA